MTGIKTKLLLLCLFLYDAYAQFFFNYTTLIFLWFCASTNRKQILKQSIKAFWGKMNMAEEEQASYLAVLSYDDKSNLFSFPVKISK